jgi:hypothetical protein
VYRVVLRDPRAKVRAGLPDPQSPAVALHTRCDHACCGAIMSVPSRFHGAYSSHDGRCAASTCKGMNGAPPSHSYVQHHRNVGWPTGREPEGHGAIVVVGDGESPLQGAGGQGGGI